MSDFALNVNSYDLIKKYSILIDEFLLDFKSKQKSIYEEKLKTIVEFLIKLSDEKNTEISIKLISSILNRNLDWNTDNYKAFKDLSEKLNRNNQISSIEINKLEDIAVILDRECTSALSRIRGKF